MCIYVYTGVVPALLWARHIVLVVVVVAYIVSTEEIIITLLTQVLTRSQGYTRVALWFNCLKGITNPSKGVS